MILFEILHALVESSKFLTVAERKDLHDAVEELAGEHPAQAPAPATPTPADNVGGEIFKAPGE